MEAAMRRMRFAIFAAILGFCSTAEIAVADDAADAWKALRAGGHVALMRHADAPGGAGDPPGFRVDDCATQRNLSEKGRADAEKIGSQLKREGIAFEKILSSPWCRCIDTARLLNLGMVETEATFGNIVVLKDQRQTLTTGARALIARWTAGGNLLVVTHGANIQALTGVWLASGEIVVVKGGSDGAEPVGRLLLE
jgi:phosphohistidine phosphatase SixA